MKKKSYLPRTWVDPRVIVQSSPIHGRGLFTNALIQKGEVVMIWGGVKILKKEYDERQFREQTIVPIDETYYLGLPITDTDPSIDEYLNHSCDPTTWLVDEVTVVARRSIHPGEEVTLDFATWDDEEEWGYAEKNECLCKSLFCRKILTAQDWKRQELQEKYKGHFSPFLEKRIQAINRKSEE